MIKRIAKQSFLVTVAALSVFVSTVHAQTQVIVTNPLGDTTTFCGLIKNLLNVVLAIGTPFAVFAFMYAGFLFIWSRGNPAALAKAKSFLRYVLIGTAIFYGSWVLSQVIASTINQIAQGSGAAFSVMSCN